MLKNAKWIWHKGKYEKNEYTDFIYDIILQSVDTNAEACISVDSEYELWINGRFVNCGQYDDYPNNKAYDILYIGEFLHVGTNRIAITAYYQGEYTSQYSKGERGLCFAVENYDECFVSSENIRCRISKTYHSGEISKISPQLGFCFMYNAEAEDDWRNPNYTPDLSWDFAIVKNIQTDLQPRPIKKLIIHDTTDVAIVAQGYFKREDRRGTTAAAMHKDYLSHRRFEQMFDGEKAFPITPKAKSGEGIYIVVDLGKESCGLLSLDLDASLGTVLDISYGEHLQDLRVRSEIDGRNFANTYICKGGKQSFTYCFKRIAGRYIEVHISNFEKIHINYIGIKPVSYPLTITGKFWCNDNLHNRIFDVCIETLKLCMHEHYEDCPWREQALYSFDSRNQALFGYYAFGEYEFPKASIELLGKSLKEDGNLNICAPTDDKLTIPSFSMMWLLEVKEYTEFSGDMYFVDNYWSNIEAMSDAYTKSMKNGLASPPKGDIYWHFYEWSEGYDGYDEKYKALRESPDFSDGVYNLILYLFFKQALWLAKRANKTEFTEKYSKIKREMKIAFNATFWDESKKVFASYRLGNELIHYGELTQSLALYTQICDNERSEHLCRALLTNDELVKITLSYAVFKYEALIKIDKRYAKPIFDDIAQKWGNMLYNGATSFWETIKGEADFNYAGSLCHGWSATPLYMYLRYILGISPKGKSEPIKDVFTEFNGEVQIQNSNFHVDSVSFRI